MRTDNTKGDELAALVRRIERLERQAPTGFTSITRGALRVASPEGLIVEGSEKVTGTLTLTDGSVLDVTGTTNLNGPTAIDGTLDVSGLVNLLSSLLVGTGGKITVDGSVPMVLGITSNGRPGVEFSGGRMSSDGSRIALESGAAGTGAVGAAGTFASLSFGNSVVLVQADGVYLHNLPSTTNAPNLYVDANGKLYSSTGGVV